MIKKLGEKELFRTKYFTIYDVDFQSDDNKTVTYQIMKKPDTALIVPVNEKGNVVFVREFFYALNEYQYGLPKGRIEPGFNDLETANKELQEETGYKAQRLDKLGILTMSPGYLTQKTHIFLARDLVPSRLEGDELETLKVIEYPFNNFEALIEEGKLTEARMIAALYMARRYHRSQVNDSFKDKQ